MTTILFYVAGICVFLLAIFLLERFVWAPQRRREAEAAPRITLDEAQAFWAEIEEDALPIAKASVQARAQLSPQETRIGGAPLAIGDDKTWPMNVHDGSPIAHIVQINFAEMPPIEDFPTQGILQIFSALETMDETGGSDLLIRWDPDPQTVELLEIPDELKTAKSLSHDFSKRALNEGLPLQFSTDMAIGNPYNWPHGKNDLCYQNRLPENEETAVIMDDWENRCTRISEGYGVHWIGGHPRFVQVDFREYSRQLRHLDRVLFHMGFDEDINVGDAGEVNVMISKDALQRRDFEKAYLSWDCS
ncbi:MAG: DUF1963 domain-containing protein [Paracoccaceae bacterium]